jgi:thiol-disulfide isomerase/thioredoxin
MGAKAVVVNVWATWCAPCIEEFPYFVNLYQHHKKEGIELVFVSADFKSELGSVRKFLATQGVDFQTYIKDEEDKVFIESFDSEWSGALPTTIIYDGSGKRRAFLSKPLTRDELEEEVFKVLHSQGD